jgi:hypothetical protein
VAVLWYIFFLCLLFFKEIGLYTLWCYHFVFN